MMISIIIPVYNEAENILVVLNGTYRSMDRLGYPYEVVLVDDGSTDRTYKLVEDMALGTPLKIVRNNRTEGKASAVLRGVKKSEGDIIVMMDGDGQHLPSEIPNLVKPIMEGRAEAVLGSRFLDGRNRIPLRHWVANKLIIQYFNLLYGTQFTDVLFGFRAFRRDILTEIRLNLHGYLIEAEVLKELLRNHRKIVVVSATCLYSRLSPILRGILLTAKLLWGIFHLKFLEP